MGLDMESVNDVLEPDMRPQSDDQGPLNYNENNAALHKPNWERLVVSTSFGTVYIERLCLTDELVVALKREHLNNDELSKEDSRKHWMKPSQTKALIDSALETYLNPLCAHDYPCLHANNPSYLVSRSNILFKGVRAFCIVK